MYENLMAIKSVMSENASIYVHIDWHIGHYVKILLDEVFGEDNFRNEITWVRTASHNDSKQNYSRVKDSIFFYLVQKSIHLIYNTHLIQKSTIADEWTKAPSGRYYKFENMLDPQNKMAAYDFMAQLHVGEQRQKNLKNCGMPLKQKFPIAMAV